MNGHVRVIVVYLASNLVTVLEAIDERTDWEERLLHALHMFITDAVTWS